MNYTQSDSYVTDPGTGQRMHSEDQAIPTAVSEADMNMLIWSLMEVVKAAGLTGIAFDKNNPATYSRIKDALDSIYSGRPNLLINAEFMVNQRGYAGAATASINQYTYDRWRIAESGYSVASTVYGLGHELTIPAGVHLEQVIEGGFVEGGSYSVAWEGTASCLVNGVAKTSGDSFTVAAGATVTVSFTSGTVHRAWVVKGGSPGAFIQRSYDEELFLCQRYCRSTFPRGVQPAQATGVAGAINAVFSTYASFSWYFFHWQFDRPMRVAPTVTWYNPDLSWDGTPGGANTLKADGAFESKTNGVLQRAQKSGGAWYVAAAHCFCDAEIY